MGSVVPEDSYQASPLPPRPYLCTAAAFKPKGKAPPPPFQLRVPTVRLVFSLFLGKHLQDSFHKKTNCEACAGSI